MTATRRSSEARRRGSLQPVELAHASVMAALCAATAIIAVVVPFAAGISLLGTVPMGLLVYRFRVRVLIAATVAGATIAFLIAGMGGFMTVINCAYIGLLIGLILRRGRGTPTVLAVGLVAGAVFGAAVVAALAVLVRLRHLIFESMTANVDGIATFMTGLPKWWWLPDMEGLAEQSEERLRHRASLLAFPARRVVGGHHHRRDAGRVVGAGAGDQPARRDTRRAQAGLSARQPDRSRPFRCGSPTSDSAIPRATTTHSGPVTLSIEPGEHVAVTGPNGSGKTTLMLMLAGRDPSSGTVDRPGSVGLGRLGGTAVILQHPESQVLGTRVADDVVWGLPPGTTTDVHQLLTEVGLDGLAERDTGGLSGGELQRLAVAAALAREPSLLIADEVTSMVDQEGRDALLAVLSGLTEHHRMSLVHITHYNDEADSADRAIDLTGGGGASDNTEMVETTEAPAAKGPLKPRRDAPVLELVDVNHEYGSGTPWATDGIARYQLRRP